MASGVTIPEPLGEGNRACVLSGISPAQAHFAIVPGGSGSAAVPSAWGSPGSWTFLGLSGAPPAPLSSPVMIGILTSPHRVVVEIK